VLAVERSYDLYSWETCGSVVLVGGKAVFTDASIYSRPRSTVQWPFCL